MSRRIIYLIAIAVFVPFILWFAAGFSDLPKVTFQGAAAVADTVENSKVLVTGHMAPDKDVTTEGGLTFYLKDEAGAVKRVVYDGSGEVAPEELTAARDKGEEVKVAGHICSDGQGSRFHAKNVYLSN